MKKNINQLILDYWHTSRTALAGKQATRHARCLYVKDTLERYNKELLAPFTPKKLWLLIDDITNPYQMT